MTLIRGPRCTFLPAQRKAKAKAFSSLTDHDQSPNPTRPPFHQAFCLTIPLEIDYNPLTPHTPYYLTHSTNLSSFFFLSEKRNRPPLHPANKDTCKHDRYCRDRAVIPDRARGKPAKTEQTLTMHLMSMMLAPPPNNTLPETTAKPTPSVPPSYSLLLLEYTPPAPSFLPPYQTLSQPTPPPHPILPPKATPSRTVQRPARKPPPALHHPIPSFSSPHTLIKRTPSNSVLIRHSRRVQQRIGWDGMEWDGMEWFPRCLRRIEGEGWGRGNGDWRKMGIFAMDRERDE